MSRGRNQVLAEGAPEDGGSLLLVAVGLLSLWPRHTGLCPVVAQSTHLLSLCVKSLSAFLYKNTMVDHPGSSHLKIFNLFPPAKSFLAIQGHIRRLQELGRGNLWWSVFSLLEMVTAGPLGRAVSLWGTLDLRLPLRMGLWGPSTPTGEQV